MNSMNPFSLTSVDYSAAWAMPWSAEGHAGGGHRTGGQARNSAPVSHSDPLADWIDALEKGLEEFTDRQHTRFQRRDIGLFVRPENRWLKVFSTPGFRRAKLNDISIGGASFWPDFPIRGGWVSLRVRFSNEVEFLLSGRLIGHREENIQRVQFKRHQAFGDHLVRSSLELRFLASESSGPRVAQPA